MQNFKISNNRFYLHKILIGSLPHGNKYKNVVSPYMGISYCLPEHFWTVFNLNEISDPMQLITMQGQT